MNAIKVVFNKEMKRIFKEPKMIFSLFILPVILMVGIYSLLGFLGSKEMENTKTHRSVVAIQNAPIDLPESITDFAKNADITYLSSSDSVDSIKTNIYNGSCDLLVVFPDNFSSDVEDYESGVEVPDVHTFFNPSENYSSQAHDLFLTSLKDNYEKSLLAKRFGNLEVLSAFTIDSSNQETVIQNEAKASGKFLASMLPYLITILLFAGTMSLGTDSITGEKERGTMASMLVTPARRKDIVLGKLLALTVLSILSACVYIIALTVSLPGTMSKLDGAGSMSVSFSIQQILMIAGVIISLAFMYVALVGITSVFSKTVKESTTYVMPIYLLVMIAGLFTIISPSAGHQTFEYLIPIYNCSITLSDIFSQEITVLHFAMTFGVSLLVGGIFTGCIVKAFNNEKVMFNA